MKELAVLVLACFGVWAFAFFGVKAFIWLNRQSDRTQIKIAILLLVIIVDLLALILLFG